MSPRRAVALVLLALALGGCAMAPTRTARPGNGPSGATGRLLVLARLGAVVENRAIATRAAELFANGLRPVGEVWSTEDLVRDASAAGTAGWAVRFIERMSAGGWPTADDRIELLRFGLTGLVTVEVTEYDQVWGKYAKFTRASVEAQAFDVANGAVMWRIHRGTEVEDVRGRAFEYALEGAINDLVAAIQPSRGVSMVELWRWWRR